MRRRFLLLLLALLVSATALPRANAQAASWKDVKIPALHSFNPAQPKRVELPNGMVLLLQEDHELPIIDGFARIRGGCPECAGQKIRFVGYLPPSLRPVGPKTKNRDYLYDFPVDR